MIGFVDTSVRQVRPISEISRLIDFSALDSSNPVVNPDGTVEQTVGYMKQIVREQHKTVEKLANKLYDPRLSRFLRNVFDFVMTYVAYEKDSAFMEQLRFPLHTLKDQKGDCDCMSILIGALLYCKNVPFQFRITKYDDSETFTHVYVIVPDGSSGYTVMDTVLKRFNGEKTFTEKKDYYVDSKLTNISLNGMPIQFLNGHYPGIDLAGGLYGLYDNLMAVAMGTDLMGFGLGAVEDDEAAMYNYLVRTRDVIYAKPEMFKVMRNPLEVARMLDYAIRYWDTPHIDSILGILENQEQRLLREGKIVYPYADLSGDELGDLGKGFFKKVGNAVKKGVKAVGKGVKTAAKATGKAVATAAKATGKAVAKGAKAVAKTVARFNPVSLAARGGLLLAIRRNMFKLADKLQWGLYTEQQVQAAGINMDEYRKMRESYDKARKIFCNTLQGKENKFKDAISKGVKNKAIQGLGELGELGAVAAATITAAMGFITAILKLFGGKKNPATGETYTDENVTEGEVTDLMDMSEQYDEDGNPVTAAMNTTAEPAGEQNFWQKAGSFIKNTASNLVSNYLPGGGGGGGSTYVPYDSDSTGEYDENQQDMIISPATAQSPAVTATVQPGGMMANIVEGFKKNILLIGAVSAIGIGAAIYFSKKKKKGLSGLPTRRRKSPKTKRRSASRTIQVVKLQ